VLAIKRAARVERSPAAIPAPFLKWAGGKGQLLDQFALLLPRDVATRCYHEPFLGGGALYFHLRPPRASLSDCNADLIATYAAVRNDVASVVRSLERLARDHSATHYYAARAIWNRRRSALSVAERAALFIYLNKTGYNGLWRVNSRGEHNVPIGRYARPSVFDPDRLAADAALLAGAELAAGSFERVLDRAQGGDFVYFDPPYAPLSRTSGFTAYAAGGFGAVEQARLADVFRELAARGCLVMLSNSDCAAVRRLYRGFRAARVMATRAINTVATRRGRIAELVIRNY
jgi:DNA adenine methylase